MTSPMSKSVVLFLCLRTIAQCRAADLPISGTDILAFYNGHYDNFDQIRDEHGGHDRMEFLMKPVLVPALYKDPVMYGEETINGKLYRRWIEVRNDSSTDYILYQTYYNFTDTSQYEPGMFNTDDLANLKGEDFHLNEGCQCVYKRMEPEVITGTVSDCRHSFKGRHPGYTTTGTCDGFRFAIPLTSDEKPTFTPYALKLRGSKSPLIDPPEGYDNPCKDYM